MSEVAAEIRRACGDMKAEAAKHKATTAVVAAAAAAATIVDLTAETDAAPAVAAVSPVDIETLQQQLLYQLHTSYGNRTESKVLRKYEEVRSVYYYTYILFRTFVCVCVSVCPSLYVCASHTHSH